MTALLEHFHEAVTIPEDVDKLKKLILQLAMQGKLVEQDPNDESASVLLEQIQQVKEQLKAKGLYKEKKVNGNAQEINAPYELPESWEWAFLSDVTEIRRGASPRPIKNFLTNEGDGIPWIKIGDSVVGNKYITSTKEKVTLEGAKKSVYLKAGSLIMSNSMSFGKAYILGIDGCIHDGWLSFNIFDNLIFDELLLFFLNGSMTQFEDKAVGTGVRNLNIDRVKRTLIPIPPLHEQKRIVEKIESLYDQCDRLFSDIVKKQTTSVILNKSVFTKLQDHSNPEQLNDLRFAIENMGHLCNDKESIAQMRNSILSLAVQGKLVEQNVNEEPASVLIEKIKQEKERLIAEKKIKKEKLLPPISEDEFPYELPQGWEWVRLGHITTKLGAGKTPSGGEKNYVQNGVKFIRSQNVWNSGLLLDGIACITEETHESMSGSAVKEKDILLNITGASIGRSSLVPDDFDTANVNQHVAIIRLVNESVRRFIHTCIISPYFQSEVMRVQVGASREGLSMAKLSRFVIAIPPFEEQVRIMGKVKSLFKIIEQYEVRVTEKANATKSLSKSLMNVI
ncbi:restriction endonuclease subunit S [Bacillus sp. A301a_S52]|jgi:type I restriction enzyme S subunit|nr:restriction endonuclease subunit S [Bacillus sp. A301a_S52]